MDNSIWCLDTEAIYLFGGSESFRYFHIICIKLMFSYDLYHSNTSIWSLSLKCFGLVHKVVTCIPKEFMLHTESDWDLGQKISSRATAQATICILKIFIISMVRSSASKKFEVWNKRTNFEFENKCLEHFIKGGYSDKLILILNK